MDTILVSNFHELHDVFSEFKRDKRWVFRGQANSDWSLLPKVGRSQYKGVDECLVFESWKRRALELVKIIPSDDWEWLAVAQHHGMATRLLDWTRNPLNAAFFAVNEYFNNFAKIFAVKATSSINKNKHTPFNIETVRFFRPTGISSRIVRQEGLFSIHPKPSIPFESTDNGYSLKEIIISKEYRESLKSELSYYGINKLNLFPDLDGLCDYINWSIEKKEYWSYPE